MNEENEDKEEVKTGMMKLLKIPLKYRIKAISHDDGLTAVFLGVALCR